MGIGETGIGRVCQGLDDAQLTGIQSRNKIIWQYTYSSTRVVTDSQPEKMGS
jgi:hypothetical protein